MVSCVGGGVSACPVGRNFEAGDEFLWKLDRIFLRKSNDNHCLSYVLISIRFNKSMAIRTFEGGGGHCLTLLHLNIECRKIYLNIQLC
jgi:hypothetical protein